MLGMFVSFMLAQFGLLGSIAIGMVIWTAIAGFVGYVLGRTADRRDRQVPMGSHSRGPTGAITLFCVFTPADLPDGQGGKTKA